MHILMAAYYGNIGRYARLRRPTMIDQELSCVIYGIHHSTMFAKWWSYQNTDDHDPGTIQAAIDARFIMNNDISRITVSNFKKWAPYLIWYPSLAAESTCRELAKRRPDMKTQVLRAAIVGGYQDLFNELVMDVIPDQALLKKLLAARMPELKEKLGNRVTELDLFLGGSDELPNWKMHTQIDHHQRPPVSFWDRAGMEDWNYLYDG